MNSCKICGKLLNCFAVVVVFVWTRYTLGGGGSHLYTLTRKIPEALKLKISLLTTDVKSQKLDQQGNNGGGIVGPKILARNVECAVGQFDGNQTEGQAVGRQHFDDKICQSPN